MQTIMITNHDRMEWARFANDAYSKGHNFIGHRYSALAARPNGSVLPINIFDDVQRIYRAWLCFGEF